MSCIRIYHCIDRWQRKWIFRTCFVKIYEIDTDSPLSVLLLYGHDICQPVWIFYFSNLPYLKKIINFLIDNFVSLRSEFPAFLFDLVECRVNVEFRRYQVRIDTDRIFMSPIETICMFLQKCNTSPTSTQYCPLWPPKGFPPHRFVDDDQVRTSQEVAYLSTTPTPARLTAEFQEPTKRVAPKRVVSRKTKVLLINPSSLLSTTNMGYA